MKKALLIVFVLALFVGLGVSVGYAENNSTAKPTNIKTFKMIQEGVTHILGGNDVIIRYYDAQTNVMCYLFAHNGGTYGKTFSCVQLSPKK